MRRVAIGLMLCALVTFSLLDSTAKYLAQQENPLQVAWLRYVFHAVFLSILFNPWTSPGVWRTRKPGLQFIRSVLLAGTTIFNFWALSVLQLDQAVTIAFATPLLVAIFAGPLIGEWVGRRELAVITIGFLGVLVVTRPGFGTFEIAFLLAFANAVCGAFYNIATRFVSAYDGARTSIVITGFFGAIVLIPVMPFVWEWPSSPWIWALHILTGVLGATGHFLLVLAHGRAPAPVLAPFIYFELAFMSFWGWVIFADVPDIWTLAGGAIVIVAGLYLLLNSRPAAPSDPVL
ncbi:DMT family transporter [Terrihabitans sp. B22-R8]|uniref:DMT family transporter n=1 Tax=Terrihabitans sp. B22-R8 TaxID=3425128 RepID=UPI00403C3587